MNQVRALNASLMNQFRNICGSGGRNWKRDGLGWVTRQGLVWMAQVRVERGGGDGRGTEVAGGQGLAGDQARGQGGRQRGVEGAGERLRSEVGVARVHQGVAGARPPVHGHAPGVPGY